MEKYVIDTNFFFNLEIKSGLGKNPQEIIENLTDIIKKLNPPAGGAKKAEFFMPQSILDEFLGFFPERKDYVDNFLSVITIKSPHTAKLEFEARVFYKLVEDIRARSYRGLQIAEEEVVKAGEKMLGQEKMSKQDFQKAIGEIIKKLRERYRQATRFGFLDSVADLDLITLTKELDGFLVSSDEGVLKWGRIFGVKEVPATLFRGKLLTLLPHAQSQA